MVLLKSALTPLAVLSCPWCCLKSADSAGGVEAARGVAKQRIDSAGGVEAARGVAKHMTALAPVAVLKRPWCCYDSACRPWCC